MKGPGKWNVIRLSNRDIVTSVFILTLCKLPDNLLWLKASINTMSADSLRT